MLPGTIKPFLNQPWQKLNFNKKYSSFSISLTDQIEQFLNTLYQKALLSYKFDL